MSSSFWHGSIKPLPVGTELLPRSERADQQGWVRQDVEHAYDLGRVYFTSDREYARAWVALARGALLRVEPRGHIWLFRKWSAAEGGGWPRLRVVSVS